VPKPPDFDDPGRPLYLTWTITNQPDGSTHLKAETVTKVLNETPLDLAIQVYTDLGGKAQDLASVPSQGSVSLPLLFAYALNMRIKPKDGDYSWSKPFLIDKFTATDEIEAFCQQLSAQGVRSGVLPPVYVMVEVQNVKGVGHIYLRSPFIIRNYLPCRLLAHIMPQDLGVADDPSEVVVASGNTGWHMSRTSGTGSNLVMTIKIYEFDWSRPEDIDRPEAARSFYLANNAGEEVWLTGEITRVSNRRYEAIVYSGYWVVDRTGLRLGFCENPRDKARKARAKQGNRRLGLGEEAQNLAVLDFKVRNCINLMLTWT